MKKTIFSFTISIIIVAIIWIGFAWDRRAYTPIITATATLNFPSTAGGTSSDLTITLSGAVNGDVVVLGVPNGSTLSNGCFTQWVSASNTVTVRFTNNDAIAALDPASGTFKVTIIK